MIAALTEEQSLAIAEYPDEPMQLIDPATERTYVILSAERYQQIRTIFDQQFHPSEAYAAIDRAFADGWDAPGMDDYDRYEEFKR